MKKIIVSNDVVMWVEECIEEPFLWDYFASEEREKWAKYH